MLRALAMVVSVAMAFPVLAEGRVLLVIEEQHDGARAPAAGAEPELARALLGAGWTLVERYDTDQARSRISIDRLLRGETQGLEVTGLSADVLIVGRVTVKKEEAPYGITYPVHAARLDLRALATDTGRIFFVDAAQGAAPGDAGTAATRVAQLTTPKLLAALKSLGAANSDSATSELRIAGLKEAAAADRLAAALAKLPGVKNAKVRYVSLDATLIDIAGLPPTKLEPALAAHQLVVVRRSQNVLEARLDEAKLARRSVQVALFANRTQKSELSWLESMIPEVMEAELGNSKYLTSAPGRPKLDPDKPSLTDVKAEVLIVGKAERMGTALRLSAKAIRTSDGSTLATAQLFGAEGQIAELSRDLLWKLDAPLYQKLLGKTSLEGYVAPLPRRAVASPTAAATTSIAAVAPVSRSERVRIDEVKLNDLFPSRLGFYAQRPLGRVVLRNDGPVAVDDLRLEVSLGELTNGPQILRVGSVPASGRVEVPIKLVLDRRRLLEVSQRRPARVDLALIDGQQREAFTEALVLWDRNALDWSEPDSVAAFVNPKDPIVVAFAAEAQRLEVATMPTAFRTPAALFDAMIALGLRYARDPLSPYGDKAVDTVQFPRETLARKIGDCDDLAVLYASLIQASGREARLLLTPGHILVAVDSELPTSEMARLGGRSRTLALGDRLFIPVEITKLEEGFAAAWQAGAAEVGRYPDKLSTVHIPNAWATWPPFPQDAPAEPITAPVDATKKLLLADAKRLDALDSTVGKGGGDGKPDGKTLDPRLQQAVGHARRGENEQAHKLFRELADSSNPALRAAAANGLGNLDTLKGAYNDAIADYQRALRSGVRTDAIEHNLGVAHFLAGRGLEAKRHFSRGTKESKKIVKKLGLEEHDTAEAAKGLRGASGEQHLDPQSTLIWIQ